MDYILIGNNKTFGSFDCELSKVRSFDKRTELFNILHSEDADHYSRLYLVGFLKHVGYTLDEICAVIDAEASWEDYDSRMTWCQVKSVFRGDCSISSQFEEGERSGGNTLQSGSPMYRSLDLLRWGVSK